jgi:hypothetical protein
MRRTHKTGPISSAPKLAFPPDPGGCLYGFGINDFRFAGPDGNDFFKKSPQNLVFGFWIWFQDVFLPGKLYLSEISAQGAYFFVTKYFRTASSMNSSGSSFFNNSSARSLGKRSRRTRVSSSASTYFFKNGVNRSREKV